MLKLHLYQNKFSFGNIYLRLGYYNKHHRLDGLNNKYCVYLKAENSRSVLADSVSGESSLTGLQVAAFLLCCDLINILPCASSYKGTNLIHECSILITS